MILSMYTRTYDHRIVARMSFIQNRGPCHDKCALPMTSRHYQRKRELNSPEDTVTLEILSVISKGPSYHLVSLAPFPSVTSGSLKGVAFIMTWSPTSKEMGK